MNFEPDTTKIQWLDLAARLQLERDLGDLPTLAELLERNYDDLLARGDRNPDDSSVRYVTRFTVLDLADRRRKAVVEDDPAGVADLARRMGARRLGILPTLESWLFAYEADMLDAGEDHVTPVLDGTSTVTTAAGWLRQHLDWIVEQPGSEQLASEVRDIVRDLDTLGINLDGPDHRATGTVRELADALDIPAPTIYGWIRLGYLQPIGHIRPKQYVRHEVMAVRNSSIGARMAEVRR